MSRIVKIEVDTETDEVVFYFDDSYRAWSLSDFEEDSMSRALLAEIESVIALTDVYLNTQDHPQHSR